MVHRWGVAYDMCIFYVNGMYMRLFWGILNGFVFSTVMSIKGMKGMKGIKKNMIQPIGENQKSFWQYLGGGVGGIGGIDGSEGSEGYEKIVVGIGPAGCGKTLLACQSAVEALVSGSVDKIVMTRPLVSVDEELGFLPGTMENKMGPWVRPIFDILSGFYTGAEIRKMTEDGVLEISPLAYMRGRTFKRVFLIADEMQNSTPNQMLMLLTRIGEGSRLVITGDLLQSDLVGTKNGLQDFYGRLKGRKLEGLHLVEFDRGDVKRSSLVSTILSLYDNKRKSGAEDAALIPIDITKDNSI